MLQTKKKEDYIYKDYKYNSSTELNKAKSKNGKYVLLYSLFLILIGLFLVNYISQSVSVTHLNYKIVKLEQELMEIENKNHQLKLKLAQDSSLTKIEEIARKQIKMVEPDKMEVIVLNTTVDGKDTKTSPVKRDNDKVFFAHIFNQLIESIGKVKAGSPD